MTKQRVNKKRKFYRENANLFLFLSGKFISVFGSAIYTFAVGLYLLKTTGSGLTFATNIVLYTLPMVLINPFAGVIADRINKKIVVVGSDFINGLFLLAVYILVGEIGLSVPLVYTSTFIITVLAIFFNIAIESAKPNLVSKKKLVKINSMARVIESGSYVAGPMVGGLVFALIDMRLFIFINGISFMLSALLEMFIDFDYNKSGVPEGNTMDMSREDLKNKKSIWVEIKEGYYYIFSRKHMKALLYIFTALNFIFSFSVTVPLPYLLNTTWKVDSTIYGIIQGGFPIGMIIGALLVEKIMEKISYSKLLKRINYSASIGVLAFAVPLFTFNDIPNQLFITIYYTLLMLLTGIIVSWVDVPLNVLLQQIVPEKILGRVLSVKLSIIKVIVPIALIISGYLVNQVSVAFLFVSGVLIFTIFNIWFFSSSIGSRFISVSNENMASYDTGNKAVG